MSPDAVALQVRELRRRPLWPREAQRGQTGAWPGVEALLPHRPPFLLVDAVTCADLEAERLCAARRIEADEPVFAGHFPGAPVYPGVLLIETMGQAGVCLASLLHRSEEGADATIGVRASRIHHALFLKGVDPGDQLDVQVQVIERDNLSLCFGGQVWVGGELRCLSIGEFQLVDG